MKVGTSFQSCTLVCVSISSPRLAWLPYILRPPPPPVFLSPPCQAADAGQKLPSQGGPPIHEPNPWLEALIASGGGGGGGGSDGTMEAVMAASSSGPTTVFGAGLAAGMQVFSLMPQADLDAALAQRVTSIADLHALAALLPRKAES